MRVIKTPSKQREYQQAGKLYYLGDGCYIKATAADIGRTDCKLYGKQ